MLEEQVRRDLGRARRHGGSLALLYFDLDSFKLVNDSLGHYAGDAVLAEAARRVAELTRSSDVLARQGGDEFLLLLSTTGDQDPREAAGAAGERIAAALDEPFEISDARFHVGASIGIALYPHDAADADMLFKHADTAMYQAKRAGGGTVAFYEAQDGDARQRLSLTSRLRKAIAEGELRLHVQPIVDVHDERIVAVEALVRWQDPEHGLIPPGLFIGVAEETGLIDGIGDWVLEELCAHRAHWRDAGFEPLLTFNLSPRQLRRSDLVASISADDRAPRLARQAARPAGADAQGRPLVPRARPARSRRLGDRLRRPHAEQRTGDHDGGGGRGGTRPARVPARARRDPGPGLPARQARPGRGAARGGEPVAGTLTQLW
jgi:diguanylate cyclase (GGDEF)-like protein